ncbi:MAG TPA: hypothetical protein VFE84_01955 [Patescibacteria group bacterium]|nr:hypothetical protein [Patescibacteria group bacterium]
MTILFICSGNIHRSALAEEMLRDEARRDGRTDLRALSAGVIAVDGMEAAGEAAAMARQGGLDVSTHRSRPVTADLLAQSDMILMMERFHHEWVSINHPAALSRCRQLSVYAGEVSRTEGVLPGDDIPDAMGGDLKSFERSFGIIRDCVRRLYRDLPPAPQEVYARAIETRFRSRRHAPMTLSPADFALVESWWDRGIPLWIVLESIDHLFTKKEAAGMPARVHRLSYVKTEVEERFETYARTRSAGEAGAALPGASAEPEGGALLSQASRQLREAAGNARLRGQDEAAGIFDYAATQLDADPRGALLATPAARLRLHDMEEDLLRLFRSLAGEAALRELQGQAAIQLREHRERMTANAFEATVVRLVAERLKELYGMPPITQI